MIEHPSTTARVLAGVIERLVRVGTLELKTHGSSRTLRGHPQRPAAEIVVHDIDEVARRVMRGGSIGFAEAYMDGLWDSPDLATLLELAVRNHDARRSSRVWHAALRGVRAVWTRLTPAPNETAVATMVDHYDLGNDFYAEWLDLSMSYSSAIFEDGDDLAVAQQLKYRRIAAMAGLAPGHRVLEIGCGWGAMTEYAAAMGCTVTAVTISSEQHSYVAQRMKEAGLDDRVDMRLCDFRDIEGTFDRVVSIEMIESIDEASWPPLFSVIERSLVPGGVAALQAITIDDDLQPAMWGREDFITSYIFPGGALPSHRLMRSLGEDAGLDWVGSTTHGPSYARTLAEWQRRFEAAWPAISERSPRFDERFRRMWRYYLAYCQAGFRSGRIDGVQAAYRKPG